MSTDPVQQLLMRPVHQLPGLSAGSMSRFMQLFGRAVAEWQQGIWEPTPIDGVDIESPLRQHHGPPATIRHLVEFWPVEHLPLLGLLGDEVALIEALLGRADLRLPTLAEALSFHERRQDDAAGGRTEALSPTPWLDPADILIAREPAALHSVIDEFLARVDDFIAVRPHLGVLDRFIPMLEGALGRFSGGEIGFYVEVGLQDSRVLFGFAGYTEEHWTTLVHGDLQGLVAAATPGFELRLLLDSRARHEWVEGFMLRASGYERDPDGPIGSADATWLPNRQAHGSAFQLHGFIRQRQVKLGP